MKPSELSSYLNKLVGANLKLSTMIWGAPGIGKSNIVQQVANVNQLELVDLRLSQLAPTDLRGLPVPTEGTSTWYPPEFLPKQGNGILFLDEINMAPPAIQGVAQQLILDRRIGSYTLPSGWFVWSAGNRKEDRAAVFDMPGPLANRFIHLEVEVVNADFRRYAHRRGFSPDIIAFIAFREDLLHKYQAGENAWPSPRSWEMANQLYSNDLDITPAVGVGPATEFYAFLDIKGSIVDLDKVVKGNIGIAFPDEPSMRYANIMALVSRCDNTDKTINGFLWLINQAPMEWVQLFAGDVFSLARDRGLLSEIHQAFLENDHLNRFLEEFTDLLAR